MTQRLKASQHDGSALIQMRGMAASFLKCEMAVDVSESGVKRPGVGDELVSCHRHHLWRTWDQVLVHSQRYDTEGPRRNRKKLFDGWRTGTGLLPWQQPSSAASFACLQSEKLWLQTWCLQDVVINRDLGPRVSWLHFSRLSCQICSGDSSDARVTAAIQRYDDRSVCSV